MPYFVELHFPNVQKADGSYYPEWERFFVNDFISIEAAVQAIERFTKGIFQKVLLDLTFRILDAETNIAIPYDILRKDG